MPIGLLRERIVLPIESARSSQQRVSRSGRFGQDRPYCFEIVAPKEWAEAEGVSVNAIVVSVLEEFFNRLKKSKVLR